MYAALRQEVKRIIFRPIRSKSRGSSGNRAPSGVTCHTGKQSSAGFLKLKVTEFQIAGEYYPTGFDGNPQGVRDSFSVPVTEGWVPGRIGISGSAVACRPSLGTRGPIAGREVRSFTSTSRRVRGFASVDTDQKLCITSALSLR